MKFKQNLLAVLLLTTLGGAGCDKLPIGNNEQTDSKTNVNTSATSDSRGSKEDAQAENKAVVEQGSELTIQDQEEKITAVPLDQYHDINQFQDLGWFTPLFLAQTSRPMSDEDKLNLMSAEYFNEQDAFRKKDLAKELMPKMQETLAKYSGDYRIKVPIFDKTQRAKNIELGLSYRSIDTRNFNLYSYNFDTQSFEVAICGVSILFGFHNSQRITMEAKSSSFPNESLVSDIQYVPQLVEKNCAIKIIDEELARRIESLINDRDIKPKGHVYFKVVANDNNLLAKPVYANVIYTVKSTGEELISKEFNWK